MESTTTINPELAETAIYVVCAIFLVALLSFALVASIAFLRTDEGAAKSLGRLMQRGNFLRISTVLFVVMAVVVLSALNAMNDGAVAVLSGVAGYVLGSLEKQQGNTPRAAVVRRTSASGNQASRATAD